MLPRLCRSSLLLLALLPAGCRVGPDYEPPDLSPRTEAPWRAPDNAVIRGERAELSRWWERLGSAELSTLAERLVNENLSLAEARQRVITARARAGLVEADRWPEVSSAAGYIRAGTGDQSLNFQGPPRGREVDVTSVSVSAAWEIDLWGRVARAVEAAEADVDVAIEDFRAASVSLLAELALAFVAVQTLHARLEVAARSVALQRETRRLAESRLEAGSGTRLDVDQATRELDTTRASVPELKRQLALAENRVALLLGERPSDGLVIAGDTLTLPDAIDIGLPADLLSRRPDVRRSERTLAGAVARIGVAEGERYPRLSLSGTLALRTQDLGNLGSGLDAWSYSAGPSLVVPLFTGGRIDQGVAISESEAEVARLRLERTLLEAIAEVENAAAGVVRSRERLEILASAAAAAERARELARELHEAGTRSLLQVIDAERAEVASVDALLVARQSAFERTIELYRALGGGWPEDAANLPRPDLPEESTTP